MPGEFQHGDWWPGGVFYRYAVPCSHCAAVVEFVKEQAAWNQPWVHRDGKVINAL